MLYLQFLNQFPYELSEGLSYFVLIAVGIVRGLFLIVDEGGIAQKVTYFWQTGKYFEEFVDSLSVVLGACEDVIFVNTGLNGRYEDLISRRHAISILIDCFLSYGSVSTGPRGHAVIKAILLDLIK